MSYAYMDHAAWVARNTKQELSDLGKRVANIIGYVGGGIYNCPIPHRKIDWTQKGHIEIRPCNMQYIKILFHQRKVRDGDITERLPDCEEIIKAIDDEFSNGYDHI